MLTSGHSCSLKTVLIDLAGHAQPLRLHIIQRTAQSGRTVYLHRYSAKQLLKGMGLSRRSITAALAEVHTHGEAGFRCWQVPAHVKLLMQEVSARGVGGGRRGAGRPLRGHMLVLGGTVV
jgi:hypothetical protein